MKPCVSSFKTSCFGKAGIKRVKVYNILGLNAAEIMNCDKDRFKLSIYLLIDEYEHMINILLA